MKAVKTENSNHNFAPPPDVTDGSIIDLPCEICEDDGGQFVRSIWTLTDVERKRIAEGANIEMNTHWIGAFAPVSLGVTDEKELATVHGLREGDDLGA